MSQSSGSKMSIGEYAIRTSIDVAAKTITPLLTLGAAYTVYYHGQDISNWIRNKSKKNKK